MAARDGGRPHWPAAIGHYRGLAAAAFRFLAGGGPLAVFAGLVADIAAVRDRSVTPILAATEGGNADGPVVTLRDAVSLSGGLSRGLPGCRSLGRSPTGGRIGGKGTPRIGRGRYCCPRAGTRRAVIGKGRALGRGGNRHLLDYHRLIAAAFLFLPGKLKDAVDADPGNARFPLGQPALLSGDKAAENAAFPGIDGIVPLVAVLAGGPGFRLAESVGLVNAAVEGLAPVLRQGFQDGGFPVLVGKDLPVGTVPGDGAGSLRNGCLPPLLPLLEQISQGRLRFFARTWLFPLR